MDTQFDQIGKQFANMYYTFMESDRKSLAQFYTNDSMMTFEQNQFKGQTQILEKIMSLPPSKHTLVTCDCQPSPNNGIVACITGDVSLDSNRPMKFSHVFQLFPNGNSYFVLNDIFRLCIG
ncbi:uncharacterized protein TOT_020000034 [Theileria orientalis strain Shintoku]|uniref:Nuclear transport factor 2 n=1 Tax=Theileria orientalis strain Shintoku TaxID=869250 RepID=J4C7W8_THEOR|nr:uncharacterized protein TOT_020000034 [Theileria orientalis strain Shintoku]PVC50548.1 hypothetical protein MACL_00002197 [Theileria orientalis]BAM39763.1 uncharacterized protein TOT_020000034 [Theileria orientalis strain Shintoku]|eukprot:XP_009690064.1 uncharacterized protein TOT_020000034 [Theileria orientalis strain Shintoku]